MHKAPKFWERLSVISVLLLPISIIYAVVAWLHRVLSRPESVSKPVIAIGNMTAGGAGKTPCAIAVATLLKQQGLNLHILTRGYGAKLDEVTRVDAQTHTASDVGDEPLLLAKAADCWVYANRAASAKAAINEGAELLLMDDGLQHHRLRKDIQLLVIDGGYGVGNALPMPAGPLREPFGTALKRVDAVILIGADAHHIQAKIPAQLPIFHAHIQPENIPDALQDKPVIAFCGIARPQKFFQTLDELGVQPIDRHAFADHHAFSRDEINRLEAQAREHRAVLLTTEKDYVRLPEAMRKNCVYLPIKLQFDDESCFNQWLLEKIGQVKR